MAFWHLLCVAAAVALTKHGRMGADFPRYEAWGNALYSSDIFQLGSRVASPLGLPLSVHTAGPGMLLSVGRSWFGPLAGIRPDFLLMGLVALGAWWLFLRLVLHLSSGNLVITASLGGLAFVGTHLGFYSGSYSSELPSFFALSLLYYAAFGSERVGWFEALLVGVASGLAVLVRAQLVMYLALPWAALAFRAYRRWGLSFRSVLLLAIALLPCLVLLVEAAYVNRWMTGSFLRSPYQFGDAQWQSVDLRRPEFGAVLLNARHGLFAYHPLYLVLFGCCVYLIATARSWLERAVGASVLTVVGLHLYLQAAWFCWWLGTGTFGMRGMATSAVVLLPALAIVLDRRQREGRAIWPLLAICAACGFWSLLLYFQGETNFNSWSQLWDAQIETLSLPLVYVPVASAGAAALAARAVMWRRADVGLPAFAAGWVGVATLAAVVPWQPQARQPANLPYYLAVGAALVTVLALAALRLRPTTKPGGRLAELVVGGFALAVVLFGSIQFRSLVLRTEAHLADPKPTQHLFKIQSPVLWDEIIASHHEYRQIPGFEEPKQRFHDYLTRHQAEWAPLKSDKRRKRRRSL